MTANNKRRLLGYGLLTALVVFLISGCALFPSNFDNQEHARIVNVHVISQDDTVCNNRDLAVKSAHSMYQDARWAWNYGRDLPNNENMTVMTKNLTDMTKELNDRYLKADTVSTLYCRSKFENIRRATDTILKVSARRPRI